MVICTAWPTSWSAAQEADKVCVSPVVIKQCHRDAAKADAYDKAQQNAREAAARANQLQGVADEARRRATQERQVSDERLREIERMKAHRWLWVGGAALGGLLLGYVLFGLLGG